ncbi:RNA-directed DNA polymerase from mobile element jockey [Elysia marginata]|uniref:RNA-directed DNA polymerase from mobile element jockey n=1 Tax=Elysia marginata TaxID=1093978 RepID=A0AAV4F2Z3_9GAST|nr:RNA-directed DNA polymerase from mobile element jockey [Elysia marginata]
MSPDLENDSKIRVLPDMVSDHRPTLITIRQNGIPPRQQRQVVPPQYHQSELETRKNPKSLENAHAVPILKKDKDPKELKSYRPISLTSCTGKVVERMPKGYKAKLKHQAIRPTAKKGRTSKLPRSSTGPRLNLKKHAANLKRKTMKRLSLIKRLASTSWGSDMDTLRSLYLAYVRSVLDYNLCLQASSSKTVQSEIDRVHNYALRFICGGMRSTPTAANEIHARIEPLGLRREKATLEIYEKAQRMNPLHPAKLLVENWKKKD